MINTTLCYIEQDGKYLMLHRIKKKVDINKGKWIGVGGKFEEGESPDECLLREVQEETGLTLTSYRCRGIVTFQPSLSSPAEYMHLYTADGFTGKLASNCPEGELKWIEKPEVLSLNLWPGDRIFLNLLEQDAPFFSLKLVYDGDALVKVALDGKPLPVSR